MKKLSSFHIFRTIISLALIVCLVFQTVSCASHTAEPNNILNEEQNVKVVENSPTEIKFIDSEGNEVLYNSEEGTLHYLYNDNYHLIEIVDVSDDGVLEWKISSEELNISGKVNTSGAPEAQTAVVVGGTTVIVGKLIAVVGGYLVKVVIAGAVCYVAAVASEAIKKASRSSSYYPAYMMFGNVYVNTVKGLSTSSAISYIKRGKSVWAKSRSLAKSACKSASPIRAAEYGWHGSIKDGFYPHFHAVKKYNKNGTYTHTGAHCWYMP